MIRLYNNYYCNILSAPSLSSAQNVFDDDLSNCGIKCNFFLNTVKAPCSYLYTNMTLLTL